MSERRKGKNMGGGYKNRKIQKYKEEHREYDAEELSMEEMERQMANNFDMMIREKREG